MSARIAVDIGGTFTDVVLEREGRQYVHKLLTTTADPSAAVIAGIQVVTTAANVPAHEVSVVIHGTTLATNAIIERKGATTALLTTAGHRDVLAMAYENRFEQYDVNIERPEPLIARNLRLPIVERVSASGEVLIPLDEASLDDAVSRLEQLGVESVAVGFLHSYANPTHEEQVGEVLSRRLAGVAVSLSSQVCPEIREYERLSTTAANAYVLPLMARYLQRLAHRLVELAYNCPFLMMTSGGGLTDIRTATKFPIRLLESGPAGGAILAAAKARELQLDRVLSFDMGGTTAKLCLIDDGTPLHSRSFEVDRRYRFKRGSGLPVRVPVIEMVEIGAGGGSIASIDGLGRIQVGPASAGSSPGPASYGLGGSNATVTDADAVMGKLDPDQFADGQMRLDIEAAEQAIQDNFKVEDEQAAAFEICEIVDENMTAAARSHATEWGKSVAERTMVAYGGAAPLHAARLLEKLKLDRVVIPHGAGVGSALGFLKAPISYEVVRSRYMKLADLESQIVQELLGEMFVEARNVVLSVDDAKDYQNTAHAFMRYVGQGFEIAVPILMDSLDQNSLRERFEESYLELYGRLIPDGDVEIMSWTAAVTERLREEPANATDAEQRNSQLVGSTIELFEKGGLTQAACARRDDLRAGQVIVGPALVTERHTTSVIPSGFSVVVNGSDLVLYRTTHA